MSDSRSVIRLSLAWKILLAFGIVVLVAMAAFSVLANRVAAREVRGFMFRGGMTDADLLADQLAAYYRGRGSWYGVEAYLGERPLAHGMVSPRATGGGVVGQDMGGGPGIIIGMGEMMSPSLLLTDREGYVIAGSGAAQGTLLSDEILASGTPIVVQNKRVGTLIVGDPEVSSVGADLIGRVNRSIWLVALAVGGVALLVGGGLVVGLLRPVRELTAASRALAGGDLSRRVAVLTHDELGELSTAFNQMAENLEQSEKLRRDMTAEVAHELRNPLAVMQARVEAIVDGVYPSTAENLGPVLDQTRLLNRLVEDLRTLALADAGQLTLDRVPTDLERTIGKVIETYRPQAEESGITLNFVSQPVKALVDPIRIQQMLANLLTNALHHTPRGGEISVRLSLDSIGRNAVLSVSDTGEGIPEEALALIFERFYGADRSRSRAEGGTGLGLAITRKLVEAHGGSIRAGNRPEGGALFTVELPTEIS